MDTISCKLFRMERPLHFSIKLFTLRVKTILKHDWKIWNKIKIKVLRKKYSNINSNSLIIHAEGNTYIPFITCFRKMVNFFRTSRIVMNNKKRDRNLIEIRCQSKEHKRQIRDTRMYPLEYEKSRSVHIWPQ